MSRFCPCCGAYPPSACLEKKVTALSTELRALRHAVWHALDDSADRGDEGRLIIKLDGDRLCELVPDEEHPEGETDGAISESKAKLSGPNNAYLRHIINAPSQYDATCRGLAERLLSARIAMTRALDALESDADLEARRAAFELIQEEFEGVGDSVEETHG